MPLHITACQNALMSQRTAILLHLHETKSQVTANQIFGNPDDGNIVPQSANKIHRK